VPSYPAFSLFRRYVREIELMQNSSSYNYLPRKVDILCLYLIFRGHAVALLVVTHCARKRKVTGSIPDGVIQIFHWHNPSGRSVALGSTQSLREMSTRHVFRGVKEAGAYGWKPCHFHVLTVQKSWKSLPSGGLRACPGHFRGSYSFTFYLLFLLAALLFIDAYLFSRNA
jgi:hypothetical protein